MTEQIAPPQEQLDLIPQPELAVTSEGERALWEREAVKATFQSIEIPELTGDPAIDSEAIGELYGVTAGLLSSRNGKYYRDRYKNLPQVTTPEGMEEVLSQILLMTEEHPRMLDTSTVANSAHMISHMYVQLPPSVAESNPQLSIRFLSSLLQLANEQQSRNPRLRNAQHREYIHKALESQFLAELAFEDPDDTEGMLTPEIHEVWKDPDFLELMSKNVVDAIARFDSDETKPWDSEGISDVEKQLFFKIFSSLGFDERERKEVIAAWGSIRTTQEIGKYDPVHLSERPAYIKKQFAAMLGLAKARFDAPKRLLEEFGVRNYFRYTSDQLLGQLSRYEEGRLSASPEVVLTASHDWNGALDDPGTADVHKVKFGEPIFIEASSTTEALRRMVHVTRRSGPIQRLLVEAHGDKEGMLFGDGRHLDSSVMRDEVAGSGALARLVERGIVSRGAEVMLFSCDTGGEDSIAQALAHQTGVRVVAPAHKPSDITIDANGTTLFMDPDKRSKQNPKGWSPGVVH